MAELMRTWMTRWLTLREHRASSWSTSTASHRTGGWWWRYSLYWWCFSWSSYSSSLDSFCSISQLMAHAMRRQLQCEVFFNFCSYYYTMYTIFTPDDKQPFTLLWSCKLGQRPHWSVALDSWVSMFPQYVWCIISGPNQTVIGDSNVSESLLIIVGSPLLVCVIYFLIVSVVSAASVSVILVIFSQ